MRLRATGVKNSRIMVQEMALSILDDVYVPVSRDIIENGRGNVLKDVLTMNWVPIFLDAYTIMTRENMKIDHFLKYSNCSVIGLWRILWENFIRDMKMVLMSRL